MVELKKITEKNYSECLKLKVAEDQKEFVAPNVYSLAQAWVYYDSAYPFAIYEDDIMVGFVMMGHDKDDDTYDIWRFMIDEKYQNKGYGKSALKLAIKYLIETFKVKEILLSFEPENHCAKKLYKSFGFEETGEINRNEVVMKLTL